MTKLILSLLLTIGSIGYLAYIDWRMALCLFVFVWGNDLIKSK